MNRPCKLSMGLCLLIICKWQSPLFLWIKATLLDKSSVLILQIKIRSVKLTRKYLRRVSSELEATQALPGSMLQARVSCGRAWMLRDGCQQTRRRDGHGHIHVNSAAPAPRWLGFYVFCFDAVSPRHDWFCCGIWFDWDLFRSCGFSSYDSSTMY